MKLSVMPAPRRWIAVTGILLLALAAYSNSFHNEFHFDDSHVVQGNLYIRSLSNAARYFQDAGTFSSEPRNATYRPLVSLSLAIDYWVGNGLDPFVFHVSQFVLLLLLGGMVTWFYARLLAQAGLRDRSWDVALFAGALFTLHTTTTETMNLVHARSEILSALGILGAFHLYMRAPGTTGLALALVSMAIGALAKVPAVIFAPLLCVYMWLFEEQQPLDELVLRTGRPPLRRTLLRALPALVVGAAVFLSVESMNGAGASYGGGGRLAYLRTQMFVWLHYARLFFLPAGLTADTDWGLITPWYDTRVVVGVVFVVGLVRLAWVSSRTPALRPVAFGVSWFILGLLPASSIFPLAEVANEHRVFLPYIGASLAVASGGAWIVSTWGQRWPERRRWIEGAALFLAFFAVAGNAAGTYFRNRDWRTEETLWKDVTEKSPRNGRALMNYGVTQMSKGRYREAKELFDRALPLVPNYPSLEVNLGVVSGRLGMPAEARAHFLRAIALNPSDTSARVFYGRWLVEGGQPSEAIPHLVIALNGSPAGMDARHHLMAAYATTGQLAPLQALARETLELWPGDRTARNYLDRPTDVLVPEPATAKGRYVAALDESLSAFQQRDYPRALLQAQQALELNPKSAEAYNNIAAARAAMGQWDEAIAASEEAVALKPSFQLARNNLAWAREEKRKRQSPGSEPGEPVHR